MDYIALHYVRVGVRLYGPGEYLPALTEEQETRLLGKGAIRAAEPLPAPAAQAEPEEPAAEPAEEAEEPAAEAEPEPEAEEDGFSPEVEDGDVLPKKPGKKGGKKK